MGDFDIRPEGFYWIRGKVRRIQKPTIGLWSGFEVWEDNRYREYRWKVCGCSLPLYDVEVEVIDGPIEIPKELA